MSPHLRLHLHLLLLHHLLFSLSFLVLLADFHSNASPPPSASQILRNQ